MAFPKKSAAPMPAAAGADLGGPPDTLSPTGGGGDLGVSPAVSLGGGKKPSGNRGFQKGGGKFGGGVGGFKGGGGVSSFKGGKR